MVHQVDQVEAEIMLVEIQEEQEIHLQQVHLKEIMEELGMVQLMLVVAVVELVLYWSQL
jgi:hypothetical protein